MLKAPALIGIAAAVALASAGALYGVARARDGARFYHDFRGHTPPTKVQLCGPQVGRFARVDPEGLRINLPKDRRDKGQVGVAIPLVLHGDFEAVATFRILQAETPPAGYGVGAIAGVDDRARVGRFVRPEGEQVILWDFWPVVDGVRKMEGKATPCLASEGRLRLRRAGSVLYFEWAPGTVGDDFEELHATEYGTDDTRFFTFVAESSGQPCAVDVLLVEYRARALSAVATVLRAAAAVLAALGTAGAVLCGVLLLYPRVRPPRSKPAPAPAEAPPAAELAAISCPKCGRDVPAPTAPGKKVKCAECGAVFAASSTP